MKVKCDECGELTNIPSGYEKSRNGQGWLCEECFRK